MRWAIGILAAVPVLAIASRAAAAMSREVIWPLPDWPPDAIQEWRTGARSFGATRKAREGVSAHRHAGIDLGPAKIPGSIGRAYGARVVAPVAGTVDKVGGAWEGDTRRIELVTPDHGRLVFGAVQRKAAVTEGQEVNAGDVLGWLEKYPNGSTMLHIEEFGVELPGGLQPADRVRWPPDSTKPPPTMLDPRKYILARWM